MPPGNRDFTTSGYARTAVTRVVSLLVLGLLAACGGPPWNNPNPQFDDDLVTYQSVMSPLPPKHLDPATSYASDESLFIDQIYEPPMGYHYLKRPYELLPLALESAPRLTFLDADGNEVGEDDESLAFTRYTMRVRADERYQPHPAFALDEAGQPRYVFASADEGQRYQQIPDFPETGSRPVRANDFVYAVKRLADPQIASPMLGFMSHYIVGMKEFSEEVGKIPRPGWLNLDDYTMSGLAVLDERTFTITIKGRYPQFVYWLTMHFFSPVAPEVDRFYHNPGFARRNLTLDWWPVGAGPFMMVKNDPNSEIVLERNPNFRPEFYPDEGEPGDREAEC
ncbi:MAG: ABC transporter substrate-binding protein, partial [Gammaproteobacteria bacterium]|nr:ABC transporter substrate-binding protein [Gammaproteobacteria bacterium]